MIPVDLFFRTVPWILPCKNVWRNWMILLIKITSSFFLETNTICYQLQAAAFRHQTERLVNDLKNAAHFSEEKLENIERKSDELLRSSDNIRESLLIVDQQTQKVSETTKHVSDHLNVVMEHSLAVFEQSQQITSFQEELKTGQEMMKSNLEQGMTTLHESYNNLGERMNDIKNETIKVEEKISEVGEAVSEKMVSLEGKADDIGKKTGISLNNQKQLLDIQSTALEGLQSLTQFQSEALKESRASLKELAEFGHKQQEMLLERQDQLRRSHDSLVENFKSMLAAQEAFEAKQAHMFIALDKLFSLHNAMLVESRLIKAFFIYCIAMFLVYVLTSTKQTYTMRPKLYMGLCGSLLIEVVIHRFVCTDDIEHQMWIVNVVRWLYVFLAAIQLLYSIYTYRDYELLNHEMLVTLMDKVSSMRNNDSAVSDKLMMCCDSDSDVDWDSWVDKDLPDDVNNLEDPDYAIPPEIDNMLAILPLKTYHLRRRPHHH